MWEGAPTAPPSYLLGFFDGVHGVGDEGHVFFD